MRRPRSAAARVRMMIFDVDGVMTDGRLWYGAAGEQLKAFHTLDGLGLKLLAASGVATAILSGRRSRALARRAAELGIRHVITGVEDKRGGYEALLRRAALAAAAVGYMGDDIVDLPVMRRCGWSCAPRDAHALVRRHAQFVTRAQGGAGAVREACEYLMRAQGTLEAAYAPYLAC